MSISFHFDQTKGLVQTKTHGLMTSKEIICHLKNVADIDQSLGRFSEIVDMSDIEDLEFKYSDSVDIYALVQLWQAKGHSLSVFWADNPKAMEITEFLLPLFRKIGLNIQICNSEREAVEFLGFLEQYAAS